jgi:hypothetical protein
MTQMTLIVDEKAEKTLEDLKAAFGVKTTADVFRRALALAKIVTENADAEGRLTIIDRDQEQRRIILRD